MNVSSSFGNRKRSRKKAAVPTVKEKAVGIDLESSGEFASVEKMLATTDANKFSPFLQSGAAELEAKGGGSERTMAENRGTDDAPRLNPNPPCEQMPTEQEEERRRREEPRRR